MGLFDGLGECSGLGSQVFNQQPDYQRYIAQLTASRQFENHQLRIQAARLAKEQCSQTRKKVKCRVIEPETPDFPRSKHLLYGG